MSVSTNIGLTQHICSNLLEVSKQAALYLEAFQWQAQNASASQTFAKVCSDKTIAKEEN